jgi:hypothetical protein
MKYWSRNLPMSTPAVVDLAVACGDCSAFGRHHHQTRIYGHRTPRGQATEDIGGSKLFQEIRGIAREDANTAGAAVEAAVCRVIPVGAEEHSCPSHLAGIAVPDTLQWPERVENVVTTTIGLGIGLDEDVTAKEELPATGSAITAQEEQSQFEFRMEEEGTFSLQQLFRKSLIVGPMPEVNEIRW